MFVGGWDFHSWNGAEWQQTEGGALYGELCCMTNVYGIYDIYRYLQAANMMVAVLLSAVQYDVLRWHICIGAANAEASHPGKYERI